MFESFISNDNIESKQLNALADGNLSRDLQNIFQTDPSDTLDILSQMRGSGNLLPEGFASADDLLMGDGDGVQNQIAPVIMNFFDKSGAMEKGASEDPLGGLGDLGGELGEIVKEILPIAAKLAPALIALI